jgi:hypothetical protein
MTPLISRMVKLAHDPESGHWFDLGHATERPDGHISDDDILRLPYPVCFLAGTQTNGTAVVLRLHSNSTHASLTVGGFVVGPRDEWVRAIEPTVITRVDGGLEISQPDGSPPSDKSEHLAVLQYIEDFLLALRQPMKAYVPTARPSLINRKRAAKGKGPVLFDWHTVTVEPPKPKAEPKGGTHASPRLHDRRGHWRRCPSGRVVWVRHCKVGDASKGVVFKDYKV